MKANNHSIDRYIIGPLLLISMMLLVSCGGGGSSTSTTTGSAPTSSTGGSTSTASSASPMTSPSSMASPAGSQQGANPSDVNITIGSKLDVDGQLNAEMYALLLQDKGYKVTTKLGLGQTPVLDSSIKSGAIDIYPEFTGTALSLLKMDPTQDAKQAYQEVKDAYEKQFNLTWLDAAYNLNDSYALCTSQKMAQEKNWTSIDDLTSSADQLTLASQQDGIDAAVTPVQDAYGIKFKNVVKISEQLGFEAVTKGDADLNVCYTTDPNIVVNNFVVLKDSKNVFPIYNPAPVVRDQLLQKAPQIADILNALQPKLTTDTIVGLIKQVSVDHKSVEDVAKAFLQDQGLLSK
ncbi:MAG: glycine betaine ABC transporter substrate-binding protein [Nitrolancea sp.]